MKGYCIETYYPDTGEINAGFFCEAVGDMSLEFWPNYAFSGKACTDFIRNTRELFLLPSINDLSTEVNETGDDYCNTEEEHKYLYKSKAFCGLYATLATIGDDIIKSTCGDECLIYKEFDIDPNEILFEDSTFIVVSLDTYRKYSEGSEFQLIQCADVKKLVELVMNI